MLLLNGIVLCTKVHLLKLLRGTRQGSILSPVLFNIFISDLLLQLSKSNSSLRVGNDIYNCFAYADDVSIYIPTVPGLQILINICFNYANVMNMWRFKFVSEKNIVYMVTGI